MEISLPNVSRVAIAGGCLCGGVRYELSAHPESVADCHCIDCRRSAGAPYVTWGTVMRERMRVLQGELRRVHYAGRIRSFAQCCGTPILFDEGEASATIDVTIASLDDPQAYPPQRAIWTEDKLPWVSIDPHLPSFLRSSKTE